MQGKHLDGQQGRVDGRHVQQGKYVAKSPEPQPAWTVRNDDRFQPREASAEFEAHPDTALLYHEAAPHQRGQPADAKNARVRRRDASPSAPQKRHRHDSPAGDRHIRPNENGRDSELDHAVLHHNSEHSRKRPSVSSPGRDGRVQDRLRDREVPARDRRGQESRGGSRNAADGLDAQRRPDKGWGLHDERTSHRLGHNDGRAGRDYRSRSDDVTKDRRDDRGYSRSSREDGYHSQRRADRDRFEERRGSRAYHEARYNEANEESLGRYQERDIGERYKR